MRRGPARKSRGPTLPELFRASSNQLPSVGILPYQGATVERVQSACPTPPSGTLEGWPPASGLGINAGAVLVLCRACPSTWCVPAHAGINRISAKVCMEPDGVAWFHVWPEPSQSRLGDHNGKETTKRSRKQDRARVAGGRDYEIRLVRELSARATSTTR